MDSAMRDLERIRERGEENDGRPIAIVAVLIGVTVALVFAMGMLVGGLDEPEEVATDDPLAHLDSAAGFAVEEPNLAPDPPDLDPSTLTFPRVLGPRDERPEVAAAMVAAAAELAHPDPVDTMPIEHRIEHALPASVAMSPESDAIARVAAYDPMVAQALPSERSERMVAAGRDGEFTVQVISYDSPAGAEEFARTLRSRGHRAFVMTAAVEGRGTMYRVRIGPFETLAEAQAFRRSFEQSERMNTLLIHRRDEEP